MTMSLKVLHSGDGYTYLTRQVAVTDRHLERGQAITDYYTAHGAPPGRWVGSGTQILGLSGEVTEAQMKALFGEGLDPTRTEEMHTELVDAIAAAMRAQGGGELDDEIVEAITAKVAKNYRLGRKFPVFQPEGKLHTVWVSALDAAYTEHTKQHGGVVPDDATRREIRHRVALDIFTEQRGRDPQDAAELARFTSRMAKPIPQAVAGYDLVFTPVKSISVLWGLGSQRVRQEVQAAHEEAWRDAISWIESHAALTRVGAGGVAQVNTNGLMVAAFDHWDSRAGDPNLHTHCAVSTKVQGPDGKWRSIDGRVLHDLAVAASERYNTRIEDALVRRLGVRFEAREQAAGKRPIREVAGVSKDLLRLFSRRREGIEQLYHEKLAEYRRTHGREPSRPIQAKLAQEATLETRQGKPKPRSLEQLRGEWARRSRSITGKSAERYIDRLISHAQRSTDPDDRIAVEQVAERVIARVELDRTTWTRWHLQAEVERQVRGLSPAGIGGTTTDLDGPAQRRDRLVHRVLDVILSRSIRHNSDAEEKRRNAMVERATEAAVSRSLAITVPEIDPVPDELRRHDGASIFSVHGRLRFTSQGMLDAEDRLVAAARTSTAIGVDGLTFDTVAAEHGQGLDPSQIGMARVFATSGRLVDVGIGPAGTGKTTSMRLFAQAWSAAGGRVIGLAPSAAAAAVLGEELGIRADTVHKLLWQAQMGSAAGTSSSAGTGTSVRPGDVLLVDEAGMAGTHALDRLVGLAANNGAVVRLLGDPQQLAAAEAGGALRLIAEEVGAAHLTDLYRFEDRLEGFATLQIRDGKSFGLGYYRDNDRIRAGSRDAMLDDVFRAWHTDDSAGLRSVMIAANADDVADLATRARLARVETGEVSETGVLLHNGTTAGVGDRVITRENDRSQRVAGGRDFVKNGDTWRVEQVRTDGRLDVIHELHGGRLILPADYVEQHVELAYAVTAHRVQGRTVDTAHTLIEPTLTRESLYVGLTRGKKRNTMYVVTGDVLDIDIERAPDQHGQARHVLEKVLARVGVETPATYALRDELTAAHSLARLVPQYEHARHLVDNAQLAQAAVDALGDTLGGRVTEDSSWPALARTLRHAMAATGRSAQDLLQTAAAEREVATASSAAGVLQWRLTSVASAGSSSLTRVPWISPPAPDTETGPVAAWTRRRAEVIDERVDALVGDIIATRPTWAADLGDCPTDPRSRRRWRHAAAVIAAYRDQYQVETSGSVLGPEPLRGTIQWQAWRIASRELNRATTDEPLEPPHQPVPRRRTRPRPTTGDRSAEVRKAAERLRRGQAPTDQTDQTDQPGQTAPSAERQPPGTKRPLPPPPADRPPVVAATRPGPARRRLLAIHAVALEFYRVAVTDSWVPQYMASRGLGDALDLGEVGYAPKSWTALTDQLQAAGYTADELEASGLSKPGRNGDLIDRFRDRLMMPIRNSAGELVAFTGRAHPNADAGTPKYLNSPSTEIFSKGETLMGLAEGAEALDAGAVPVIVEGPLDRLAVAFASGGRAVGLSPGGTALTAAQIAELARVYDLEWRPVVVATDPDPAGQRAAEKAWQLLIDGGAGRLRAARLPEGLDPAKVVEERGTATLAAAVTDNARPLIDQLIDQKIQQWDQFMDNAFARVDLVRVIAAMVAQLPEQQRIAPMAQLAARLDLDPGVVAAEAALASYIHEHPDLTDDDIVQLREIRHDATATTDPQPEFVASAAVDQPADQPAADDPTRDAARRLAERAQGLARPSTRPTDDGAGGEDVEDVEDVDDPEAGPAPRPATDPRFDGPGPDATGPTIR